MLSFLCMFYLVLLSVASQNDNDSDDDSSALTADEAKTHQSRLFSLDASAQDTIIAVSTFSWVPAIVLVALFFFLRPWLHRIYNRRAFVGETVHSGNWLHNIISISPETAFSSGYSLDGCTHILAWAMMFRASLWLMLVSPLPLLLNWFGAGFSCPSGVDSEYEMPDGSKVACGPGINYKGEELTTFEKLTMASFRKGSSLVWGHVVVLWMLTLIVVMHLRQADGVFTALRAKWLLKRPPAMAKSLMAVNVTARSDKEFRDRLELMFPGKIADAHLVKFCDALAKTCAKLEKVEKKIEEKEQIAAENSTSVEKVEEPENDNKVVAVWKKIVGPDLHEERAILLTNKAQEQKKVVAKCEAEEKMVQDREVKSSVVPNFKALKQIVHSDLVFSNVGFVTFTDIRTATLAAQAAYSTNPTKWQMDIAPDPRDILWQDMASNSASTNQKRTYIIVVAAVALFLLCFPIISILQGFVDDGKHALVNKHPSLEKNFFFQALDPILKTLVLLIFFAVLPAIFRTLSIWSGRMVETTVFLEMQFYLFLFKIIFVIYTTSLGKYATNAGHYILHSIGLIASYDDEKFDFNNTFGTSVPSEFPSHYTFAAKSFIGLSLVLLQVNVLVAFALQRFLLHKPSLFSWMAACKKCSPPRQNVDHFVTLAVLLTIALMIYQVFPLNGILFCALFLLGSICFRYRVLYVDGDLVDSGGLYWAQFELHVILALILTQISACLTLSSIQSGLWTTLATVPLPIMCGVFLQRMRNARWRFLSMEQVSEGELEKGDSLEFLYRQPQLDITGGSETSSSSRKHDASSVSEGRRGVQKRPPAEHRSAAPRMRAVRTD